MNTSKTNNGNDQEYIIAFRVYVQANGSMVVTIGNQKLDVTPDEVHALLCGTMEYARVFAALHQQIDATTSEILNGGGGKR